MNRVTRVLKPTRTRMHAAAASAAFALIAGLSAPAVAANAGAPSSADAAVVQDNLAAAAKSDKPAEATAKSPAKAATSPAQATDTAVKKDNPAAPAAAAKAWAPSGNDLHPVGVSGSQESFTPSAEQLKNARAIVQAGEKMGLPARAWVIAVATSMQESQLKNIGDLGDANDHDSLGLFQQRPSSGWGAPHQLTDPNYAATAFYKGLVGVSGWDKMALTDAAQAVQVSAFPDHYAKWENEAGDLVNATFGNGPYAAQMASTQ